MKYIFISLFLGFQFTSFSQLAFVADKNQHIFEEMIKIENKILEDGKHTTAINLIKSSNKMEESVIKFLSSQYDSDVEELDNEERKVLHKEQLNGSAEYVAMIKRFMLSEKKKREFLAKNYPEYDSLVINLKGTRGR